MIKLIILNQSEMKKIFIVVILALTGFVSHAQFKSKYIHSEIVGTATLSGDVKITIDYGDKESEKRTKLVGKDGKTIKFGSMVAAMNYMGMHGWEYVDAYTITHGSSSVYHYIMKKPFSELDPKVQALYKWD